MLPRSRQVAEAHVPDLHAGLVRLADHVRGRGGRRLRAFDGSGGFQRRGHKQVSSEVTGRARDESGNGESPPPGSVATGTRESMARLRQACGKVSGSCLGVKQNLRQVQKNTPEATVGSRRLKL